MFAELKTRLQQKKDFDFDTTKAQSVIGKDEAIRVISEIRSLLEPHLFAHPRTYTPLLSRESRIHSFGCVITVNDSDPEEEYSITLEALPQKAYPISQIQTAIKNSIITINIQSAGEEEIYVEEYIDTVETLTNSTNLTHMFTSLVRLRDLKSALGHATVTAPLWK